MTNGTGSEPTPEEVEEEELFLVVFTTSAKPVTHKRAVALPETSSVVASTGNQLRYSAIRKCTHGSQMEPDIAGRKNSLDPS